MSELTQRLLSDYIAGNLSASDKLEALLPQHADGCELLVACRPEDFSASAIARALSPEFLEAAAAVVNPYGGPDTLRAMTDAILSADLKALRTKRFHDINTDNI